MHRRHDNHHEVNTYYAWKVTENHRRLRARAVSYKGGKCEACGYSKCIAAFDFHHIDPSTKDFTISSRNLKWETLVKEIDKCQLLCANCHREAHEQERQPELQRRKREAEAVLARRKASRTPTRPRLTIRCHCGNSFRSYDPNARSCSRKCAGLEKSHARPSNEKLEAMVRATTLTQVGKALDVTRTTIKRWCRQAGITVTRTAGRPRNTRAVSSKEEQRSLKPRG